MIHTMDADRTRTGDMITSAHDDDFNFQKDVLICMIEFHDSYRYD
jgi:hypothetical protein